MVYYTIKIVICMTFTPYQMSYRTQQTRIPKIFSETE